MAISVKREFEAPPAFKTENSRILLAMEVEKILCSLGKKVNVDVYNDSGADKVGIEFHYDTDEGWRYAKEIESDTMMKFIHLMAKSLSRIYTAGQSDGFRFGEQGE